MTECVNSVTLRHRFFPPNLWALIMDNLSDYELLVQVANIWSQQEIADRTGHPREVINRWLKAGDRADWLVLRERRSLEKMLPEAQDRKHDFTFIDLFAGIGGIRKGFESAGGKCVFTSEYNKYAVKTYLANYHTEHPVHGDIREITQPKGMEKKMTYRHIGRMIPDHDVLVAGFPCQPFSIAGVSKKNSLGRAHGFECETQGTLFFDVARIIDVKRPLAVMLENVKNLKSHDRGKTFSVIASTLDELGYEIADLASPKGDDPKIIDARYFAPQHRERIVIVAFRKDLNVMQDFTLSNISQLYPKKAPTIGDILEAEDTVPKKYILTEKLWSYLKGYADKHKAKGNGFGFGKVTRQDKVARTLSARYYKDGSEILVDRGSGKRPRRLTPRECARLMGFDKPSESKFIIPVSDTQAYKQFGNSVVVPVFEAVAKLMKPLVLEAKLIAEGKRKPPKRQRVNQYLLDIA